MALENKERLWIVSELFYPEEASTAYILTKIANKLSQKYSVHVLAGTPVYEGKKFDENEIAEGVTIHRLASRKANKDSVFGRMFRAMALTSHFKKYLKRSARRGEKVFAVTNPVFNIIGISKVCKKKKLNLIILAHDIFPENTVSTGFLKKNSFVLKILMSVFDKAYRHASKIITIGNDMTEVIKSKIHNSENIEVCTIQNWANTSILSPLENNLAGKITVKFAGNLGRVQGFEKLIPILKRINNPNVQFVFQGSGACKEYLKNNLCETILVKDSYKREDEAAVLAECDIGLVCLDSGMYGLGVPSKSYNLMASGKPILFVGPKDSEIYRMVKDNDIGWAFANEDEDGLVEFLNSLSLDMRNDYIAKGKKAYEIAQKEYSEDVILERFFECV